MQLLSQNDDDPYPINYLVFYDFANQRNITSLPILS